MTEFRGALSHGSIEELFPDVFFVTGTMRNEFFGSVWQFSRNMTVVRENGQLTIVNSVRLDGQGLATLDALGKVVHVVRIGDMHGIDDLFYVQRCGATFWALPGMGTQHDLRVDKELTTDGEMPFSHCSLFEFKTTNRPEAILRLDRAGGVMIACDSLQNWVEPDEFFLNETVETMRKMGFFARANLGLAWLHESGPKAEDFIRLKEVPFKHALCGHGSPLRDTAQESYHATFARMFKV